jgi:tripartite-type tricarboxylate transporter receptor subunit TctC
MPLSKSLVFLVATLLAVICTRVSAEPGYPNRNVRLVVGFAAGSTADVAARILGQKLSEILGKPLIVENRPGAGSAISTDYVARAPKDGYTLLFGTIAATINTTLSPHNGADFGKDLAPVTLVGSIPNFLVIYPELGASNVKELIAIAREKQIFYGSAGIGSSPYLTAELFKQMAKIDMTAVEYPGSAQAVEDLIAGRVQIMFSPVSSVIADIRQGSLKALATTENRHSGAAPELPTIAESGLAGFDTGVWFGILAPSGTPTAIIDQLSQATNQALKDPDVIKGFQSQGMDPLGGSPQEFGRFIASETDKWANVIHAIQAATSSK